MPLGGGGGGGVRIKIELNHFIMPSEVSDKINIKSSEKTFSHKCRPVISGG